MRISNFFNYINRLKNFDLYLIFALSVVFLLTTMFIPDNTFIRVTLGVPFVIFFPGYGLISALWPEKKQEIDSLEKTGLSIGLSIAIVSLMGLGLNYTSFGLELQPLLAILFLFNASLVIVSVFRRRKSDNAYVFKIKIEKLLPDKNEKIWFYSLFILTILVICLVIYTAFISKPTTEFTAIYILDSKGGTHDYPKLLNENENATVIVGVHNREHKTVTYTIVAEINKNATLIFVDDWDTTFILTNSTAYALNITLEDGQTWEKEFNFTIAEKGHYEITWYILVNGEKTPYSARLNVDVV